MSDEKSPEELESEQKQRNKESGKYLVYSSLGLAGVIIIVFLLLYIFPFSRTESLNYNGFTFNKIRGSWHTQWQDHEKNIFTPGFRYNPKEVEDVPTLGTLNSSFSENEVIYLTFEPNASQEEIKYVALGTTELLLSLMGPLKQNVITGCANDQSDACINRSIVTCDDKDKSVIFIKAQSPTGIVLDNNCVIIQGEGFDLVKSVDRLLFQWYKIIT